MDITSDIKIWLRKMGYDRNVEDINYKRLITPATVHIWMQLIKSVRPKQEIELIRNNILINRLSSKKGLPPGISQTIQAHALKELEIYNKKQELEKQMEIIKDRIRQNEEKLKELMMKNRIKYVTIENIKYEIENNKRYTFLLKAKAVQLKKEIARIQDILQSVKTSSPVEEIKTTDEKEILNTLSTCAQKLEVHLKEQKVNDENSALLTLTSSTLLDNSIFKSMSTKKKINSAKKQLIPPHCRRALTPILQNNVGRSSPILNDESILMKSGNISNLNITFNVSNIEEFIKGLVHNYNRRLIWNCLQNIFAECRVAVSEICMNTEKLATKNDTKSFTMVKLYHAHIKNELLIKKHENAIKSLETQIEVYKNMILMQVNNSSQAKMILEHQIKAAGLKAALDFMQKELSKESNLTTQEIEIAQLKEKLHNLKEQTISNLRDIEQYLNYFKSENNKLLRIRDWNVSLVEKLYHFAEDSDWTQPLNKALHTQEIEAFSHFPLEDNRVKKFGDRNVYIRDLCTNTIPYQKDIDQETLYKYLSIIVKPCCFPEKILYEIAETITRMKNFEKLKDPRNTIENTPKYTLKELKKRESYVENALDNLNRLVGNDATRMTSKVEKLKEIIDVWLEMPFGRYISKNRLVNEKNFEFYEKQYDYYYSQL